MLKTKIPQLLLYIIIFFNVYFYQKFVHMYIALVYFVRRSKETRDDLFCDEGNLDCDEIILRFGSHVRSCIRGTHPRNLRVLTTGIILRVTALWAKPLSVSRPFRLGSLRADLQHWWGRGKQRAPWMCVGTLSAREIAAKGSVSCNVESS